MKSLLIDALRQANGQGAKSTLSDSGSFDTTGDAFAETANDEIGVEQDRASDELELLQSTGVLIVDHENDESSAIMPAEPALPVDDLSMSIATLPPAPTSSTRVPKLSYYSPIYCAALAVLAAGCWFSYEYLNEQLFAEQLGTAMLQSRSPESRGSEMDSHAVAVTDRFPFLPAAQSVDDGGSAR